MMSPAASFLLSTVEHTPAKTFSKFCESDFVVRIICDEPSDDGTNPGSGVLFPSVVAVNDSAFGCGDVCCDLFCCGTLDKLFRVILKEKSITRTTLILK